jgi:hypothetical protein
MMPCTISATPREAADVIADIRAHTTDRLTAHGARVESAAKARWVGWKNPTGTSLAAWRTGPVEASGASLHVTIHNDAETKKGQPYTGHVHRSGVTTTEVSLLERDEFPPLTDVLRSELSEDPPPLFQ